MAQIAVIPIDQFKPCAVFTQLLQRTSIFTTTDLNTAVSLLAAGCLKFAGCSLIPGALSRVQFKFYDPAAKGIRLALKAQRGELVAPTTVTLSSLSYLRLQMTRALSSDA